jgi:curved DNA-binding protein CbpA
MERFDSSKNYYEVLGVAEDATADDILRGYRNRARELHPDRGGNEEDMKLLNEAHDVLGNEAARRQYDEQRRPAQQTAPLGSSAAFDPDAASNMGTLEIKVADPDYFGLVVGAAMCLGLGLPFLALIEMQYVFFLWPLRLLTVGVLMIGVLMAHAALRMRRRRSRPGPKRLALEELGFWLATAGITIMTYLLLYARSPGNR